MYDNILLADVYIMINAKVQSTFQTQGLGLNTDSTHVSLIPSKTRDVPWLGLASFTKSARSSVL